MTVKGINDYGQLDDLKVCGRCGKPIKNIVSFVEEGYGYVHVLCHNLKIIRSSLSTEKGD